MVIWCFSVVSKPGIPENFEGVFLSSGLKLGPFLKIRAHESLAIFPSLQIRTHNHPCSIQDLYGDSHW
jgi:hypothetical protein